ncbi:DUF2254 domain-containing protein [Halobacillus salinus]|uniref:DUF2254 domain-containing protein n=1 Tax=Halobacillus salinus TaxID=192814 RepID=A0A4Z0H0U6_9BACI|nr:DUF2254 domain-containing protein [Halobacillus salinus]TGB03730.1 DUF2254 domain-containing protein [Halobacillus salinus]
MQKPAISKYFHMTKRERRIELNQTLWLMPLRYILVAILLSGLSVMMDVFWDVHRYLPDSMVFTGEATRLLVTTLIGGVLTLSAFTINSLLVALTTLSGQFSSRMLLNFISVPPTQHVMGIFNGTFIYVLLNILFLSNNGNEAYFIIPVGSVVVTFVAAITFVYFVNHVSTWLQVHNISSNMKSTTSRTIRTSLVEEIGKHRAEGEYIDKITERKGPKTIYSGVSGHLQSVNFSKIVEEACKDNIVIKLRASIGQYILEDTPLFDYWEDGNNFREKKYKQLVRVDEKKTEIQDLEYGLEKLVEVSVKALGNNDPLTVNNTLYQITDLLKEISRATSFSPILVDSQNHVRLKLMHEDFDYFLFKSYGYIREYAGENSTVIITILEMLGLLAQATDNHEKIWEFAEETVKGFREHTMYRSNGDYVLEHLYEVARHTGQMEAYSDSQELLTPSIQY